MGEKRKHAAEGTDQDQPRSKDKGDEHRPKKKKEEKKQRSNAKDGAQPESRKKEDATHRSNGAESSKSSKKQKPAATSPPLQPVVHNPNPSASTTSSAAPRTTTSWSHINLNPTLPSPLPPLPQITNPALLKQVFTHASTVTAKHTVTSHLTYERLEFIGDAWIELAATLLIDARAGHLTAGKMAQLRETLVRNTTLARFARAYALDARIVASPGMRDSVAWDKIVADVFEAYVAAIVKDAGRDRERGLAAVEAWLGALWEPMLPDVPAAPLLAVEAKTLLAMKICTKDAWLEYRETRPMETPKGTGWQRAYVAVYFTGFGYVDQWLGEGQAPSKREAGVKAAEDAMANNPLVGELEAKKAKWKEEREAEKIEAEKTEAGKKEGEGAKDDAVKQADGGLEGRTKRLRELLDVE